MAVSVALLLLAGTTAGVASADQGGRVVDGPAARVASAPAGLDSLLPADQLAPTGPAQWYMPWFQGGAGSNYLGQGGWRSYTPNYSPWGPYPTPQTAAFFGATNSPLDPWTTFQLTNMAVLQNQLQGQNGQNNAAGLQAVAQTGLAPIANANLATLQQLGIGTAGVNGTGSLTFGFSAPGSGFVLPAGQGLNAATLGQLVQAFPLVQSTAINGAINGTGGFPFFGFGGMGNFGGFPYGFGLTPLTGQ
ncbi:MAG TPA: hypothetical protein VII06_36145 [Chloroflexota bacterium]|jgi:hypothetical protein